MSMPTSRVRQSTKKTMKAGSGQSREWYLLLRLLLLASALMSPLLLGACGFVGSEPISKIDPPGFFSGVWHGLIAPWTLIVRLFLEIRMYSAPNLGWFYDLGFCIGIAFSIPVGWIAAIVALLAHVLG
jgi:hypothetical protein